MDREFIATPRLTRRASNILKPLSEAAGEQLVPEYTGTKEWVFLWGPGGQLQQDIGRKHRATGGQVVFLDIGYFHRYRDAARISFNGFHPPKYLPIGLKRTPRFSSMEAPTGSLYNPTGHILLCGTGVKSRASYYLNEGPAWEERALNQLQHTHPGVPIVYRPKPGKFKETLEGTVDGSVVGTIEDAIRGARLVVCQHSNVQVDALRYGVPFQADDGILVGNIGLGSPQQLLEAVSWFNWLPSEAADMLRFIEEKQKEIVDISKQQA